MRCECFALGLKRCACEYMTQELRAGSPGADVARVMFMVELPRVGGEVTQHFAGCPCPRCFDLRRDWTYLPPAPRRESWPELRGESA